MSIDPKERKVRPYSQELIMMGKQDALKEKVLNSTQGENSCEEKRDTSRLGLQSSLHGPGTI